MDDHAAPDNHNLPTDAASSPYAWLADAQSAEPPLQTRRRIRQPLAILGILVILAGLAYSDHQTELLGGRIWAPAAEPTVPPSGLTFCDGISAKNRNRVELAAAEMSETSAGEDLLAMLIGEKTCIAVGDLTYALAGTAYSGNPPVLRVRLIMFDEDELRLLAPDEAAAVLVHEATHAARILNGTGCAVTRHCQRLPNGVYVEEEVAAHAAEAQFWIDLHGPEGTGPGITSGYYLNKLAEAWEEGPEAFRDFVISIRSGPEEEFDIFDP